MFTSRVTGVFFGVESFVERKWLVHIFFVQRNFVRVEDTSHNLFELVANRCTQIVAPQHFRSEGHHTFTNVARRTDAPDRCTSGRVIPVTADNKVEVCNGKE